MKSVENIPCELMTSILLKLSVKSLLRFRCVCKTWYALIKSPSFISSHLKSHKNNEDTHLVVHNFEHYCDPVTYPFEYALFCDKTLKDLSYQVVDSQFPIHGELFGPYDGLFVVYQREYNRIYLWNIATRETRALPQCRFVVPHNMVLYFSIFGCGYDPLSDDYKLVFLRLFHDECGCDDFLDSHVSLYSFNNDSWRDLQVPELRHYFRVEYFRKNSYSNGVCYWLAKRDWCYENKILSFDISCEIFRETNLPECGLDCRTLEVVNDSLYLLALAYNLGQTEFRIWVMRDGCWTIQSTTIDHLFLFQKVPVGYWRNDTIFIFNRNSAVHLLLHDLNSEEEIDFGIPWSEANEVYRYNESLVSIKRENDFSEVHVLGVI